MNRVRHLTGKSLINHTVPSHKTFPLKLRGDDYHTKVPTTGCCAGMASMESTLVFDAYFGCRERLSKRPLDLLCCTHFFPCADGKAGGLRSCNALTPSRTSAPKNPNISNARE